MKSHSPPPPVPSRLKRERTTLEAMITLYCRSHHSSPSVPCAGCRELLDYALLRLDKCPFGGAKPTCANCRIHCYRPAERERIKTVMRYSGPRMLLRHPVLALFHLIDGRRAAP